MIDRLRRFFAPSPVTAPPVLAPSALVERPATAPGPPEPWDADRVIRELQEWAEELGRTPKSRDTRSAKCRVSPATATRYFGSWANAIAAAGLDPLSRGVVRDRFMESEIIAAFAAEDTTMGAAHRLGCCERTLRDRMEMLGLETRRVTRLFRDGVEVSADAPRVP